MDSQTLTIIDSDGVRATLAQPLAPDQTWPMRVTVRLEGGRLVEVPSETLTPQPDGTFRLSVRLADLAQAAVGEQAVIPVVEERLDVRKRVMETGVVRVHKTVEERQEVVDQAVTREEVRVERVPINQVVDAAPAPRQEGDTLIVPLLEEVLVVEKRLMLREEVRITKLRTTTHDPQTVTLRREDVTVERPRD